MRQNALAKDAHASLHENWSVLCNADVPHQQQGADHPQTLGPATTGSVTLTAMTMWTAQASRSLQAGLTKQTAGMGAEYQKEVKGKCGTKCRVRHKLVIMSKRFTRFVLRLKGLQRLL